MSYTNHENLIDKLNTVDEFADKLVKVLYRWTDLRGIEATAAREVIINGNRKFDEQISLLQNAGKEVCKAMSAYFNSCVERLTQASLGYSKVFQELESPCMVLLENASEDSEQVETVHSFLTTGASNRINVYRGYTGLVAKLGESCEIHVGNMRDILKEGNLIINTVPTEDYPKLIEDCNRLKSIADDRHNYYLRICSAIADIVACIDQAGYIVEKTELALATAQDEAKTKRYAI